MRKKPRLIRWRSGCLNAWAECAVISPQRMRRISMFLWGKLAVFGGYCTLLCLSIHREKQCRIIPVLSLRHVAQASAAPEIGIVQRRRRAHWPAIIR
ncbi:hypothetical protein P170DRAFT_262402 [Aspergillus steynii IBT 23096]|uniref:Uncharacterized protein n=1 Tax=Aspergillus steynii IBT 23096 TaxID=1392250 RepID=A0A2I2FZY6_9EURO|nr:uncharacterized protein P170DRAFT_262402 [Aspergillus steynii IBT 23096]PLB46183.1 hypothetical protein P170DRAFT_262402 [Aspergillus steynii IBT 23096]